jgi:2-polyprenyl-3-methyl-5-hydroxy-6-metoxy-1,4-benzoquinol methylase
MTLLVRLRAHLRRDMRIVEIGASHHLLVAKRDGWRTTVSGHAWRDALAIKYAAHGVDLSQLEDVDVAWNGGDLAGLLPPGSEASYDAVVASHVLEHLPDPIWFLIATERLLKPDGLFQPRGLRRQHRRRHVMNCWRRSPTRCRGPLSRCSSNRSGFAVAPSGAARAFL